MDKKLLEVLFAKHPKPWRSGWTCSDNGWMSETIEDANGDRIINPETGYVSDELYDLLLSLGEAAEPHS